MMSIYGLVDLSDKYYLFLLNNKKMSTWFVAAIAGLIIFVF
ncbi:MAG: hypothetical protein WC246_00305 [Candidatus Paceibacterota bacterium]